jgi:hypothetical protein
MQSSPRVGNRTHSSAGIRPPPRPSMTGWAYFFVWIEDRNAHAIVRGQPLVNYCSRPSCGRENTPLPLQSPKTEARHAPLMAGPHFCVTSKREGASPLLFGVVAITAIGIEECIPPSYALLRPSGRDLPYWALFFAPDERRQKRITPLCVDDRSRPHPIVTLGIYPSIPPPLQVG